MEELKHLPSCSHDLINNAESFAHCRISQPSTVPDACCAMRVFSVKTDITEATTMVVMSMNRRPGTGT